VVASCIASEPLSRYTTGQLNSRHYLYQVCPSRKTVSGKISEFASFSKKRRRLPFSSDFHGNAKERKAKDDVFCIYFGESYS